MTNEAHDELHTDSLRRKKVANAARVVVKFGSAALSDDSGHLAEARIRAWCQVVAQERKSGREVVIVSSGAVAAGMAALGWQRRPTGLHRLQAAAAVGQVGLAGIWRDALQAHGLKAAMVLLTRDDMANRRRYLNARATLTTLLDEGVIPIINENDSVATDEIRFGDNDTLAALVTNLLAADALVLMTDRDGLYTANPDSDPSAQLVPYADADDSSLDAMVAGGAGPLGRGGMTTKLNAARLAARSGAQTVIASGLEADVLASVFAGDGVGSLLGTDLEPMLARKRWIADQLETRGEIVIDTGAVSALRERGVSLLPVGARSVSGDFNRGDMVRLVSVSGEPVAQGLVNYAAGEVATLCGVPSEKIVEMIGYRAEPELLHRDNLVLL